MLLAQGTSSGKIKFTSSSETPESDAWGFIEFADSSIDAVFDSGIYTGNQNYVSGSILEYCIVEYGNSTGNGAVLVSDASPFINYCNFQNNSLTRGGGQVDHVANAIKFNSPTDVSHSRITNNTFSNNKVAIDMTGAGNDIAISGNTFDGNWFEALELSAGTSTVIFSNNIIYGYGTGSYESLFLEASASASINIINNQFLGPHSRNSTWSEQQNTYTVMGSVMEIGSGIYSITGNVFYKTNRAIDSGESAVAEVSISNNSFIDILSDCYNANNRGAGCAVFMRGPNSTTISNNKFHSINLGVGRNDPGVAITLWKGGTITNNTFSGNTGGSLISRYQEWQDTQKPFISNNNFDSNNVSYNIYLHNDTVAGITATNNWWGTTNETEIEALIYDWNDNATLATVDYTPVLNALNTTAPPLPPSNVAAQTGPTSIGFTWDANPESDIAGYKLYYDTDESGYPYDNSIDIGNLTSYTLSGLNTGTTYYAAIAAYDSSNDESWISNEITATTLNTNPISADINTSTFDNTPIEITLNGSDSDLDSLTYSIDSTPTNGSLGSIVVIDQSTSSVIYTPSTHFSGIDTFTYFVNDGNVNSETATVTVDVVYINDPPTVYSQETSTFVGTPTTITLTGSDPDGHTLGWAISNVTGGSIEFKSYGQTPTTIDVIFTPASGFIGTAEIYFYSNDSYTTSNTAVITINVMSMATPTPTPVPTPTPTPVPGATPTPTPVPNMVNAPGMSSPGFAILIVLMFGILMLFLTKSEKNKNAH